MLTTDELLNGLPSGLTLRFFATFARLEYALKQSDYWRPYSRRRTAMPDRDKLAARLGELFFIAVRDAGNAATLINTPPKDFVADGGGGLAFGEQPPPVTTTLGLLAATWQVRNNLFHGNKMFPGNRHRDQALMRDALSVIAAVLNQVPEVSGPFHEPQ